MGMKDKNRIEERKEETTRCGLCGLEGFAAYELPVNFLEPRVHLVQFIHGFGDFFCGVLVGFEVAAEVFVVGCHVEEAVAAQQEKYGFLFPCFLAS